MKIELTPDAELWVEAMIASGRFATAEEVVRFAIESAKRDELRSMLDASEAEGGSFTSEDAREHVRKHLDRAAPTGKAS